MTRLTADQYAQLTQPIHVNRVGKNAKGFSHVEAWDVRRHLDRIFGFGGWDLETISCTVVSQIQHTHDKKGNPIPAHLPRWTVVYQAQVRLTIKATDGTVIARYEDGAVGDSCNQSSIGDAHNNAMKTALSGALKRCAVNLGDQFGLSLYNKGGGRPDESGFLRPEVVRSLDAPATTPTAAKAAPIDQAADDPVQPEVADVVEPDQSAPAGEDYSLPVGAGYPPGDLENGSARTRNTGVSHSLTVDPQSPPADRADSTWPIPAAVPDGPPRSGVDESAGPAVELMSDRQRRRMFALFSDAGQTDPTVQRQFIDWALKQPRGTCQHRDQLTPAEADAVIGALMQRLRQRQHAPAA